MVSLISVIVPVYNIAPYIPRCLDSILKQSYNNIEIIVIDDGSKDNSGNVVDEYVANYPNKIRCFHIPNSGVTNARLTGIRAAKGEWIGFVDGDDEIETDMYERLIYNAQTFDADISHCGYQTIVNDGERIHYFHNTGRMEHMDKQTGIRELLCGTYVEPGLWNKLYHKKLFRHILSDNVMDCSIKQNEDLLMNYLLFFEADSSVYEDFCAYHYMARDNSATRVSFNKHKIYDPIKVWNWILEHVEITMKDEARRKLLRCYIGGYTELCKFSEMKKAAEDMRKNILEHKEEWRLLSQNDKLKVFLIYHFPRVYPYVNEFYVKYMQKKIYE